MTKPNTKLNGRERRRRRRELRTVWLVRAKLAGIAPRHLPSPDRGINALIQVVKAYEEAGLNDLINP
jgi:ribosomal protein L20